MPKLQIYKDPEQPVIQKDQVDEPSSQPVVWEFSKENIQPIAQGRKFDTLVCSLETIPTTKDRQTMIDERKDQFEADLKANIDASLPDQLDLWRDYIDWLDQNVPDGGKVNELSSVIEKCIECFYDKKELKQDKRLFNIFMKLRRFCDQPIEIFHFMYANAICTLHAEFYIKWSWHCEKERNLKRAEDLLKLGLKNLASPRELLEEACEQLKLRIDIMISNGESIDPITTSRNTNGPARTLQALKFHVSKRSGDVKVPINRICGSRGATSGGLKGQATKASQRPQQIPTQIYSDQPTAGLKQIGRKVPTSQQINSLGRQGGDENDIPAINRRRLA